MSDWPRINPGELRKKVDLQRQPNQVDGIGQPVLIWPSYLQNVPAAIDPIDQQRPTGRQQYDEGLITSRATHIITIRWPGKQFQVQPGDRVFFADQMYSPPALHYYTVEWSENVQMKNVLLRIACWEINAPA